MIQSVEKSNKGKINPRIRNAFLSNNPGKNALAVKSATVELRLVGLVESDDTFETLEIVSRSVIYIYNNSDATFYVIGHVFPLKIG